MSDYEKDYNYYLEKEQSLSRGQYDQSTVLFTRALKNLNDPGVCYDLATIYYRKGDYQRAIKKYRLTLVIDPDFCLAFNAWGSCLSHLGRYDEAILKFEKALEIDPGYGLAPLNWGLILFWQQKKDEAEKIVQEGMKYNDVDQEIIINAYKLEVSSDEKKLEKASSEEEKEYLKRRIAGYHWLLELLEKIFENGGQNNWTPDEEYL